MSTFCSSCFPRLCRKKKVKTPKETDCPPEEEAVSALTKDEEASSYELRRAGSTKFKHKLEESFDEDGSHVVNDYVILRTLGKGTYGKVKLVLHTKTGELFAIKVCNKSFLKRMQRNFDLNQDAMSGVRQEIAILKRMRHENVVRLFEVIDDPDNEKLFLVEEYIEKGPVMQVGTDGVAKQPTFTEDEARAFLNDILDGLSYLHAHKVLHRDIKPENILMDSSGKLKLTDFGVSRMFEGDDDQVTMTGGTPAFLSPEACSGHKYAGRPADVWATGVTLYVFLYGRIPFNGESYMDMQDAICRDQPQFPDGTSPLLLDLFSRMLHKDPTQRATVEEVMAHPWVTDEAPSAEHVARRPPPKAEEVDVQLTPQEINRAILKGGSMRIQDKFSIYTRVSFTHQSPSPPSLSYAMLGQDHALSSHSSEGIRSPIRPLSRASSTSSISVLYPRGWAGSSTTTPPMEGTPALSTRAGTRAGTPPLKHSPLLSRNPSFRDVLEQKLSSVFGGARTQQTAKKCHSTDDLRSAVSTEDLPAFPSPNLNCAPSAVSDLPFDSRPGTSASTRSVLFPKPPAVEGSAFDFSTPQPREVQVFESTPKFPAPTVRYFSPDSRGPALRASVSTGILESFVE